jgi:hypothetical protein
MRHSRNCCLRPHLRCELKSMRAARADVTMKDSKLRRWAASFIAVAAQVHCGAAQTRLFVFFFVTNSQVAEVDLGGLGL